eukprot:4447742-Amphidinium_carterae.2
MATIIGARRAINIIQRLPEPTPIGPAPCYSGCRPIQFTFCAFRTQGSVSWPFAKIQWSRLLRVATSYVDEVHPDLRFRSALMLNCGVACAFQWAVIL